GTYFHGLFDHPLSRHSFLRTLKPECDFETDEFPVEHERAYKERQYDLLAEHFETYLDMVRLMDIVGIESGKT
ncbi:MAG: cobyric acid synthase CobQ, partial [Acidobacteriota bacterium]